VALAFSLSVAQAGSLDPHTIVVSGYAEILVKPDHATVDIGVVTSDKVTAKALQANNVEMQRVVAAIKALGISDDAMQTSEFSINALHPLAKEGYVEDESITLGYQVSNKVTVSVTDLNKVADIIDAAVNVGANSSNRVSFNVKNRTAYDDQELAAAVRNARHNAEVMASAEQASVGKMISMTNGPLSANDVGELESVTVTGVRAPILPGQITIQANVVVTYAVE
jgi:uncharacterized protein YggE